MDSPGVFKNIRNNHAPAKYEAPDKEEDFSNPDGETKWDKSIHLLPIEHIVSAKVEVYVNFVSGA